jgi:hypothetical protein
MKTHKMEFDMINTDRNVAKEYVEYEEYYEEFNTDRSLFRGYHNRMDEEELRYQLLDSIDGPMEDAMYEASGSKIYTIPETLMLEELEKTAEKENNKYVNYPTKVPEKNPVKLSLAQRSTARSSPALSKSKKITVKQPPAHSSPALSNSKKIAVKQPPAHRSPAHSSPALSKSKRIAVQQPPALSNSKKIAVKQPPAHSSPAHSSPTKQPPATLRPSAFAQAWATLGLPDEDTHGPAAGGGAEKAHLYIIPARRPAPRPGIRRPMQDLAPENRSSSVRADSTSTVATITSAMRSANTSNVADSTSSVRVDNASTVADSTSSVGTDSASSMRVNSTSTVTDGTSCVRVDTISTRLLRGQAHGLQDHRQLRSSSAVRCQRPGLWKFRAYISCSRNWSR